MTTCQFFWYYFGFFFEILKTKRDSRRKVRIETEVVTPGKLGRSVERKFRLSYFPRRTKLPTPGHLQLKLLRSSSLDYYFKVCPRISALFFFPACSMVLLSLAEEKLRPEDTSRPYHVIVNFSFLEEM